MTIKIAFIHHHGSLLGASRSLVNLIEGLQAYDVEPYVIVSEKGDVIDVLERIGCRVEYVPYKRWVAFRGRLESIFYKVSGERWFLKDDWEDTEHLLRVVELLKTWDVDLVQSNSAVIPVGHYAARLLALPHIWHLREFMNNYGFHFLLGEKRSMQIINSSAACIAISDCVAQCYFDDSPGIKRIISNGVLSLASFSSMREKSIAHQRAGSGFVFGMIGMIHPSKGFETSLRAFKLLVQDFPAARLAIAGSGELDTLKKLAASLGISSRVDFLGFVKDPFDFYPTIDALLMCSKREAMGRVTVEANALCKPVIGYDEAGTSELIQHGRTGLLYRGGHQELAASMRLFLSDPELARQMGMAAWETACAGFSVETYSSRFYQVVEEVLASNKGQNREREIVHTASCS